MGDAGATLPNDVLLRPGPEGTKNPSSAQGRKRSRWMPAISCRRSAELLRGRLEHFRDDAGDEPPRRQPLPFDAEQIPYSRNRAALPFRQSLEPDARHFLRRFGVAECAVRLSRDLLKFSRGRPRTEGA